MSHSPLLLVFEAGDIALIWSAATYVPRHICWRHRLRVSRDSKTPAQGSELQKAGGREHTAKSVNRHVPLPAAAPIRRRNTALVRVCPVRNATCRVCAGMVWTVIGSQGLGTEWQCGNATAEGCPGLHADKQSRLWNHNAYKEWKMNLLSTHQHRHGRRVAAAVVHLLRLKRGGGGQAGPPRRPHAVEHPLLRAQHVRRHR